MRRRELAIHGCGGHGRTILDVVLTNNPDADIIFVDEEARPGETIETKYPRRSFKIVRELDPEQAKEHFVAIGDNTERRSTIEALGDIPLATVIANDAQLGIDAKIEPGSFVGHRTIVGPFAHVGKGVIINTRSHISHEVQVGNYSQLALDVVVGGRTRIGENVFIGMGALIFDRKSICSGAKVSAGSIVRTDITIPGIYDGWPARLVRDVS